jgi:hypothetical protein
MPFGKRFLVFLPVIHLAQHDEKAADTREIYGEALNMRGPQQWTSILHLPISRFLA